MARLQQPNRNRGLVERAVADVAGCSTSKPCIPGADQPPR